MAASRMGSAGRPMACAARCRLVFIGFRMAARGERDCPRGVGERNTAAGESLDGVERVHPGAGEVRAGGGTRRAGEVKASQAIPFRRGFS